MDGLPDISMKDQQRTREQLTEELTVLRKQVGRLSELETARNAQTLELLDSFREYVFAFDAGGRLTSINQALLDRLGYGREEILDRGFFRLYPSYVHEEMERTLFHRPEDRRQTLLIPLLTKEGEEVATEATFLRGLPDGETFHYCVSRVLKEKTDEHTCKTREEMHDQGRILDIVTGRMEDMVYYKDKDFRYVFSSEPHCRRVLKCRPEECVGRTDEEIMRLGRHGENETGPVEIYGRPDRETHAAGGFSRFETAATIDGERVWLEIYSAALYDAEGEFAGIVTCSRDMTARKGGEQRLRESERRLRQLIEGTNDMITVQDRAGRFLYYNGANKYGFESRSLLGKTPHDVFRPDEASVMMRHMDLVFDSGRSMTTEEELVCGAEPHWFSVNRFLIQDEESNTVSVASISRNITDRKRMEEDLIKSQKLESIGTLAGGIAHDFNNILTVILGNITLAKMSVSSENKATKRLADAEKATMRAKDLTQQLLTFAKGGEPFKKVVFINRLIEESVNLSCTGSNIKCDYEIAADLFPVEIDEGQVRQVINNVMVNAKEAMPSGGVVSVKAKNVIVQEENDLSLEKGYYVRVEIADKGQGIPGEYLPRIFDPYFTTKEMGSQKGTGLGLAICYSIVRKHNGCIKVDSSVGVGTTFSLYLPAYEKHPALSADAERARSQAKGRVLLMDDEGMIREITAEILDALGYEAEFVENGDEAIERYMDARASHRPFDVVILDLTIPGGMGGKETIQKLIDIDPHVQGILSSGYSNDPIMAEFRKYGFSGIITKPFKIEELGDVLKRIMTE